MSRDLLPAGREAWHGQPRRSCQQAHVVARRALAAVTTRPRQRLPVIELAQDLTAPRVAADGPTRCLLLDFLCLKLALEDQTPVPALRRAFDLLAAGDLLPKEEDGRGERRLTLLHDRRTLLRRLLGASRLDVPWVRAVRMSGWRPPPRKRPPARYNATTFQVRRQGYRTVGEIAAAAGIPLTTFRRWMGGRLPDLPEHQGIKAVPESEFEHVVRVCKAARAAARARGDASASDEALARGFARHGVCPSRAATAEVPPSAN